MDPAPGKFFVESQVVFDPAAVALLGGGREVLVRHFAMSWSRSFMANLIGITRDVSRCIPPEVLAGKIFETFLTPGGKCVLSQSDEVLSQRVNWDNILFCEEERGFKVSPLAHAIYEELRGVVDARQPHISYSALVERLGPMPTPNENLQARDSRLDEALGELVTACRHRGLPAISSMVVLKEEKVPGPGYYVIAHPNEAHDRELAMIAWYQEAERVQIEPYPESL